MFEHFLGLALKGFRKLIPTPTPSKKNKKTKKNNLAYTKNKYGTHFLDTKMTCCTPASIHSAKIMLKVKKKKKKKTKRKIIRFIITISNVHSDKTYEKKPVESQHLSKWDNYQETGKSKSNTPRTTFIKTDSLQLAPCKRVNFVSPITDLTCMK